MDTWMKPTSVFEDRPRSRSLTAAACVLILLLAYLFSCVPGLEGADPRRSAARMAPTTLPASTPEEQGMDSELLAEAIDFLLDERDLYNIHSLTIIRHGHIVADIYFHPYQPGYVHELSSTAKVFLTTLIGIAVDKGYIESIDERVIEFFPNRTIANRDARKEAMTVEHLLTMTSGLGFDDDADSDEIWESSDSVQAALNLPMSHQPGTWWNYHQPTAFLLSAILSEVTGINALEFAREHLFGPLGIVDARWTASPNGVTMGWQELKLTPHDLAKFGQLILQQGSWEGEQLVSPSWIDQATGIQVGDFYGYMWSHYVDFPGMVQGGGGLGQRLILAPSRDLVVAFTGGGYANEDIERIYLEALRTFVFPSVQSADPLPPNPFGAALLAEAVSRAESPGRDPEPVGELPAIAHQVSGRTCVVNVPYGYLHLTLSFPSDDEGGLIVVGSSDWVEGPPYEFAAGLDGIERISRGPNGIPAAGTGEWPSENTFVMDVDQLGNLDVTRFTFVFDGDFVTITVEDPYWWDPDPTVVFTGRLQD